MNKRTTTTAITVLLGAGIVALVSGFVCPNQDTTTASERAVLNANNKFFEALNAMFKGDAEPFEGVWWHTDDIVYMGADGAYNVGWAQTYANWKEQAAIKIGGTATPSDIKVSIGEQVAMTNQYVTGVNTFEGETKRIRLRSTSVFRKKGDTWKMICHHVDVIPELHTDEVDDN